MHQAAPYQKLEEFQNRSRKLDEIKELGVDPYPHTFRPEDCCSDVLHQFEDVSIGTSEEASSASTPEVTLAGRLVLFRAMGKNAFAHLQDGSGRLQLMFNRDATQVTGYQPSEGKPSPIKFIEKKSDLGDIIGVKGHLFRTQKGELTVLVREFTLLCKTLLPLPDKHSGLADKELRYRKRWLDLIASPDVRTTFRMRSKILQRTREFLQERDFLEVETPVLQSLYGGANAKPFVTELNALDQTMYLRISLEIALKKLLVGGVDRVFEMGKVFRNESIDRNHNPEFTLMEAYAAYWDYEDMMRLVEELFESVALELFGTTRFPAPHLGELVEIDVKAPWTRMSMKEAIQTYGNIDVDALSNDGLIRSLTEQDPRHSEKSLKDCPRGLLIAQIFEERVEPHLVQPHHITDHPIETTPLCKLHRNPELKKEGIIERFESFILSGELCNAYSELNDPILQRKLLEEQNAEREQGDEEAHPLDEEFLEAICQGMPPAGGIGIGMDRMVMLFTAAQSIRDVLYFPWMR